MQPIRTGIDYDLKALDIFLDVCRTGSMTETAVRYGLTQPAVSQITATLEKTVGEPIFDRRIRPLQLTPAGRILRESAQKLLLAAEEMARNVQRATHGRHPHLALGIVDSVVGLVASDLMVSLEPVAESVSIRAGLAPRQRDAFTDRRADMIITSDPFEEAEDIECYELVREPFVVVVPPSMADLRSADMTTLAQHAPLVRYSKDSHIGQQIEQHLRRMRLKAPRVFEVDVSDALLEMVRTRLGWTISTPLCLMSSVRLSDDFVILPLNPGRSRAIYLISRKGELGTLPRQVADLVTRTIQRRSEELLLVKEPWLRDKMIVGQTGARD